MTGTDVAYFTYLLLFLAFIGVSYLASTRSRLGQSVQQMAIWCLIFFGFIAVYGMREALNEQLFPEKTIVEKMDGSYVFQREEDGHFYATLLVNNVPVKFAVDTGATTVVLNRDDARRVGIDPDTLNYSQTAYTANGRIGSAPVVLHDVRIGQTAHSHLRASVNQGDLHTSLMGMEYINRFSEFRIVKDLLYLTP
ncbi:aspartyl protease [Amylibacter marinus]|uniref:Aspartyl protease n=1 Tax=Amylibacter marinus TaxID=1475483 RepID=A0ABQ5VRT8_9RHOB|nr:TIGR02281 family clan AA aspartic protease [Amylibacter marinus]GLQ34133.1 aspartyl protease [Amylibacter marinus]